MCSLSGSINIFWQVAGVLCNAGQFPYWCRGDFVLQMDAEDNSKEPCHQLGCFKKDENENVSMWRVSINGWECMKDSKVSNAV